MGTVLKRGATAPDNVGTPGRSRLDYGPIDIAGTWIFYAHCAGSSLSVAVVAISTDFNMCSECTVSGLHKLIVIGEEHEIKVKIKGLAQATTFKFSFKNEHVKFWNPTTKKYDVSEKSVDVNAGDAEVVLNVSGVSVGDDFLEERMVGDTTNRDFLKGESGTNTTVASATFVIYVDQPVPGKRTVFNAEKQAGHTWWQFNLEVPTTAEGAKALDAFFKDDTGKRYSGIAYYNLLPISFTHPSDLTLTLTGGKDSPLMRIPENKHQWNIKGTFQLTLAQLKAGLKYTKDLGTL